MNHVHVRYTFGNWFLIDRMPRFLHLLHTPGSCMTCGAEALALRSLGILWSFLKLPPQPQSEFRFCLIKSFCELLLGDHKVFRRCVETLAYVTGPSFHCMPCPTLSPVEPKLRSHLTILHIAFDRNSRYVSSNRKLVFAHFRLSTSAHSGEHQRLRKERPCSESWVLFDAVGFVGLAYGILYP